MIAALFAGAQRDLREAQREMRLDIAFVYSECSFHLAFLLGMTLLLALCAGFMWLALAYFFPM